MNKTTIEKEQEIAKMHEKLWEKARRQGVKPVKSYEDLIPDFPTDDFDVDEFLNWVDSVRHPNRSGEIVV